MHTFTGDKESLRKFWEDEDRAVRFKGGGTREVGVHKVLNEIQKFIQNQIWIDVAPGAGFVQSVLPQEFHPSMFVGIDISLKMLKAQSNPLGERIQGTSFALPFRKNSSDLLSIFFSLSDYPDIQPAILEFYRICGKSKHISFTDYGTSDEYWLRRQEMDGKVVSGKKIIGNINLRCPDEVLLYFPKKMEIIRKEEIKYQVRSSDLKPNFELPEFLYRCFTFLLINKNQ